MIRSHMQPKAFGEILSYALSMLIYLASAYYSNAISETRRIPQGLLSNFFHSVRSVLWLEVTLSVMIGLLFSWMMNQFCKNHKILGTKTNTPILMTALGASMMFEDANTLPWLIISVLMVLILDAIFSAQEQEKDNLSGILLVGTLLFLTCILNPLCIWFIPVILLAFGLFLFFSLKRFTALLIAFLFPMFIVWGILTLSGHTAAFYQHFSAAHWLRFHVPFTGSAVPWVFKVVFLLPFFFGWISMVVYYGQNAAKQRKIQSVMLIMGLVLFPLSEITGSEKLIVHGLSLFPLVVASSAFYIRPVSPRWLSFIFLLQVLAWTGLRFYPQIEPFLQQMQLFQV